MQDLKIIFIGTPEFGATILNGLIGAGYKPVLVITKPESPVKIIAEKYNIPVGHSMSNIKDLKPDLVVVAAYGQILPKKILETPKYDCLNVHPSLLPKYRGPSPIQTAILNGDSETGVSIIKMAEKVDAGEIISIIKRRISNVETYETLSLKLADLGAKLLSETIPGWVAGKIKALSQDETKATYTKILKKEDGLIDWKSPIDYIERQVRALNPWPGTYTLYNGRILKILRVEIINDKLIIKEVQPEGKKPMNFDDFLRGHNDFKIPC